MSSKNLNKTLLSNASTRGSKITPEDSTDQSGRKVRVGRVAALALSAAITATAIAGHEGALSIDDSTPEPTKGEQTSVYMQENAAEKLIKDNKAQGETAIYVVKPSDGSAGEIAENLGTSEVVDWIKAQNDGSAVIRENERYAFPVDELDSSKVTTNTVEAPINTGINAQGELEAFGPQEEIQFIIPANK